MFDFALFGVLEMLILGGMGGGLSLPVGLPPTEPDAKLAHVAPEKVLLYASWSGTADADPNSTNKAEQLLADKQVRHMITTVEKAILSAIESEARRDEEKKLAKHIPLLIKIALTQPTAIWVEDVQLGPAVNVEAALIVNLGKQGNAAKKSLDVIEGLLAQEIGKPVKHDNGLWKLNTPPDAPLMTYGHVGDYFVFTMGTNTAKQVPAGLVVKNLADKPGPKWLRDAREKLKVKRESSITYINLGEALKKFGPIIAQQMGGREAGDMMNQVMAALGLDKVTSIATVSGFDDVSFVTRSRTGIEGQAKGVLKIISDKPLTAKDLSDIPADADLAFAGRIDASMLWDELRTIIGAIDRNALAEFDAELANAEDELGFSVKKDLIDSLGDTVQVYNSPGQGGLVITGLTGVVTIKDRAKARKVIDRLVKIADQEFNRFARANPNQFRREEIQFKKMQFMGETIEYTNPIGDDDFIVAPAWCLLEDRFVIAPYPQMIKAYLMHRQDANARSLATVPAVKAMLAQSQPPSMISYTDTPSLVEKFYPLLHPLLTSGLAMMQEELPGLNIDIAALPTASAIVPHLTPDASMTIRTADGLYSESRGTLSMVGSGAIVPVMMMGTWMVSVDRAVAVGPPGVQVGPPHDHAENGDAPVDRVRPAPRELTDKQKSVKALNELRQVGVAIFLYHARNNKMPDKLSDLTPRYIKELDFDPWGKPYVYLGSNHLPAAAGSAEVPFVATSHTIDGKRIVLYGDGHVETVDEATLRKQCEAEKIKLPEAKNGEKNGAKNGAKDAGEAPADEAATEEGARSGGGERQGEHRVVNVKVDGSLMFEGKAITQNALEKRVKADGESERAWLIRADRNTPYKSVLSVMTALKEAGVDSVKFVAAEPKASRPPLRATDAVERVQR